MAYERLDKTYTDGQVWDGAAVSRIDDAIEALDTVLDAKVVEVEKTHYSSNRFNKNSIPFTQRFFLYNNTSSKNGAVPFNCNTTTTGGAGGGWLNVPVTPGKTYTIAVNDLLTLSDLGNVTYGVFTNLWFTDNGGNVVTCVPANTKNVRSYYNQIDGSTSNEYHIATAYNTNKVVCKAYGAGKNTYNGLYTNALTFTVIDESITHVQIQVGSESFGQYQVKTEFVTRGCLTDDEVAVLQNSFQINEGSQLLDYEEFGDYSYTELVAQSNLTKLQDAIEAAFSVKEIPSTNLLDPSYVYNHQFVRNYTTGNNEVVLGTDNRYALLKIPVEVGSYVLSSKITEIGNSTFGYFGLPIFLNDRFEVVTSAKYPFKAETGLYVDIDATKVYTNGIKSNKFTFEIFDETIKWLYIALWDTDSTNFGMWSKYEPTTGLTDEELYNLVYNMQLNKGTKALKWEAFDNVTKVSLVTSDRIEGLDTFQTEMAGKIDEAIAKMSFSDKQMVILIDENDNDMYIRAKQYTTDNDLVWHMRKVRLKDNRYFNLETICTCPVNVSDEDTVSNLTTWKSAMDDIGPSSFNGTYIAGNHGFSCVDRVTVTGHDKTEADIGSVWVDSTGKTYVLVYVYDENSLGFIRFTDSTMATGKMSAGSPAVGTSITHSSGATNTSDVVVEAVSTTQAWKSWNHYTLRLFVDGVEHDMAAGQMLAGDRIEVVTEYNIIYIPAMLNYLVANVGNNTADSQNSDDITDYYAKVAITYQFNKNGSVSEYNSYYINKELKVGYIGLVQSISLGVGSYTYLPDTVYDTLTLHDGSVTQRFSKDLWNSETKAPYRYYQFKDATAEKGMCLTYDRSIGRGNNEKRLQQLDDAGMYYTSTKMYPSFISGGTLTPGTYFDGMAARIPLYKVDPDITSIGWYWSNEDIILMIDSHQTVNKDIILPNYMKNLRIEKLDITDSVNMEQTYLVNNKLRFQCTDYGYAVLRLYK